MTEPGQVHYIQYIKPQYSNTADPVIVNGSEGPYADEAALLTSFNAADNPKYDVALANFGFTEPVSKVPALQHYRLVHESPTRVSSVDKPDVRDVKIFEFVPGAVIHGEGIIEIPVVTNTGRNFTYRQESVNGSFIVPYPSNTKVGDITTLGPYRINSTGKEYKVTEDQVQNRREVA